MTKIKEPEKIISEYIAGYSCNVLAKSCGVTAMTIHKLLIRHGIPRRTKWAHKTLNVTETELSDYHEQIIEGCLLGDGSVLNRTLSSYFTLTSVEQPFVDHLGAVLPFNCKITSRDRGEVTIHGKSYKVRKSYNLVSLCDKALARFREKWYDSKRKIIPTDLILNPTSIRYWFYGDGSTSIHNKKYVQLTLCTNNFTVAECELLQDKLIKHCGLKLNIYTMREQPTLKAVKSQTIRDFFDYIGQCEVPCYSYKWKLPKLIRAN